MWTHGLLGRYLNGLCDSSGRLSRIKLRLCDTPDRAANLEGDLNFSKMVLHEPTGSPWGALGISLGPPSPGRPTVEPGSS